MANTKDLWELRVNIIDNCNSLVILTYISLVLMAILFILIFSKVVLVVVFFCKIINIERYDKISQIIDWSTRAFSIILFILNTVFKFIETGINKKKVIII